MQPLTPQFAGHRQLAGLLLALLAGLAGAVQAAGFALIEQSVSGQGRAFAGAAAVADDAATVYFNPAGMSELPAATVLAGGHLVLPRVSFHDQGSTTATGKPLPGGNESSRAGAVVPNAYLSIPLGRRLTAGLGINTPFGLITHYDDDWVGRYHAVESEVKTLNVNPALAFAVTDRLSIGAGVNAQYIDVTLSSAVDMGGVCAAQLPASACAAQGLVPQQSDGFVDINGTDWAYGYNLGLLWEPLDGTRLGLAYRSQMRYAVSGSADFKIPGGAAFLTDTGSFIDTGVSSSVTLPDSANLALAQALGPRLTVLASVLWTGWRDFDELRIAYQSNQPDSVTTENWDNNYRFAFGLNWQVSRRFVLRSGIAYDQTPIPDATHRTPRIPGNDRRWLSFGVGYQGPQGLRIDLGYSHLEAANTAIDNTLEASIPSLRHRLTGEFAGTAVDIVALQVGLTFL